RVLHDAAKTRSAGRHPQGLGRRLQGRRLGAARSGSRSVALGPGVPAALSRSFNRALRSIYDTHMRARVTATVILAIAASSAACGGKTTAPVPPSPTAGTTAWADEFDGAAGSLPDASKWTYDLGAGGWGNQELQTYTNL